MNLCQEVILEGGQADPSGSLGIVSLTKDWRLGSWWLEKPCLRLALLSFPRTIPKGNEGSGTRPRSHLEYSYPPQKN